jgi:cysteine synthase
VKRDLKIANSMLDLIGDIPLVRLNRVGKETGAEILIKPEFLNPSGSIKDRIAKFMIESAEKQGQLKPGVNIIEASTGNTGTSLAFVGAVKGYKVIVYAPLKVANPQRAAILLAFGAQIEKVDTDAISAERQATDPSVHGGRIEIYPREICRDLEKTRDDMWWARQFSSVENIAAHREWTGKEILEQTDGQLDVFAASVGTGGTLLGIAQALKAKLPNVKIVGVEPAGSPMLAGKPEDYPIVPGITDGIIPEIFRSGLVDRVFSIADAEAIEMAHRLAEEEGMFCGMSSGANVVACIRMAKELGPRTRIVTVLPDSRDRYLAVEKYTT